MKETIISARRKKTELQWLLVSFVAAFILNIISIIAYNTSWKELYSKIHIVFILAVIIYILLLILRLLFRLLFRLIRRGNKN